MEARGSYFKEKQETDGILNMCYAGSNIGLTDGRFKG